MSDRLLAAGQAALQRNDIGAAITALRDAVQRAPAHPEAALMLAWALHRHAALEEAEALLAGWQHQAHAQPVFAIALANVQVDRQRHAEALATLERLPMPAWREPLPNQLRAVALWRLGRGDEALQQLAGILRADPHDADALQLRGLILQERDALTEAAADFTLTMRRRHRPGAPSDLREHMYWSRAKLRHDVEQLAYLAAQSGADRMRQLQALHAAAVEAFDPALADDDIVPIPQDWLQRLQHQYNRLHHLHPAPRLGGPALNPALDWSQLEARYLARDPGIDWWDGFLSPQALAALREHCLASTFWFDFLHPNGYLGASFQNGFCAPLLLQIAEELRAAMPRVFGGHPLTQLWAFKYDTMLEGIDRHADLAAVNLNFWITPDDANLDPEGGGLLIWDRKAPPTWDFAAYNNASEAGQARIGAFLKGAAMVRVPYRENRAVLFDSDLFHRTDRLHFRPGYANRRINITMLFGHRVQTAR